MIIKKFIAHAFFFPVRLLFLKSCILLLVCIFPAPHIHAQSELPDTIRVGAYENPPKVFTDARGRTVGIFPDLLRVIAEQEGWNLLYVNGTWEECLHRLENSEIDIMPDVAYSGERSQKYDFSEESIFINWGAVYTRIGFSLESLLALKDARLAVMRGSIHTDGPEGIKSVLEKFNISCQYIEVNDYAQVFRLLDAGDADAGVVNRMFGDLYEKEYRVSASSVIFNPIHLRFVFPKNSEAGKYLEQKIDSAVRKMKKNSDSEYYSILSRYLSRSPSSWTAGERHLELSEEEKAWIQAHPLIRMGADPGFPPFEFISPKGEYRGMAAEYVKLIGERLGLRFEILSGLAWKDVMEKAAKQEIDVLPCVGITAERKKYFTYTRPYLSFPRVIVTRTESDLKSLEDLGTAKVAVQINSSHEGFVREHTQIQPVLCDTFQQAMLMLSQGDTDAVIGNLAVVTHVIREMSLSNLKIAAHTDQKPHPLAFAVRKDWPILADLISRALDSVSEEERIRIFRKWTPLEYEQNSPADSKPLISLTEEETYWIRSHPIVRVAADPKWAPVEFLDDRGHYQGIAQEYLKIIANLTGLQFETLQGMEWKDLMQKAADREMDMFSCLSKTPERNRHLNFTRPWLSVPVVIFARNDVTYVGKLSELKGHNVAVVQDNAAAEWLARDYPDIKLLHTESTADALQKLQTGQVFAFVGDILSAGYYLGKLRHPAIKVAGDTPYVYEQSLAVRSDWPMLAQILQKALDAIPETDRNAIYQRWISVKYERGVNYSLIWKILTPVILLLLMFFYWNRRLSAEIAHRTEIQKELRRARDAAEFANRSKSVFLANMSHEIRTPMNAILGYTQIMEQDGTLTSEQQKYLHIIGRSGEHLLSLINDILEMSKIEAGKIEISPVSFDLHGLIHDLEMMFQIRTAAKGLQLEVLLSDDLPSYVFADEGKIRQVLINLMGNAVKFTQEGGIVLRIARKPEISEPDTCTVCFEVEDTGSGISAENLERIFHPFEQKMDDRNIEGTGLGLAISREYARLMKGDIQVRSQQDRGSCFSFTLPVKESADHAAKHLPDQRVLSLRTDQPGFRILVVDDRESNRDILTRMLERVGFSVKTAENGKQALAAFENWHPHALLLDIRMPVMDGVEVTKRIKGMPEGKNTVIIAVSASALEEERKAVLAHGADAFIRKPFREKEIFDQLHISLGAEYVYEAAKTGQEAVQQPENMEKDRLRSVENSPSLPSVPKEMILKMRQAAEGGYMDQLQELIDQITEYDIQLAEKLRTLADAYEYEKIVGEIAAHN
ncbi:MAG: transporter substrate-binding domain-containing protein [Desulfobacterales bacterium]